MKFQFIALLLERNRMPFLIASFDWIDVFDFIAFFYEFVCKFSHCQRPHTSSNYYVNLNTGYTLIFMIEYSNHDREHNLNLNRVNLRTIWRFKHCQ